MSERARIIEHVQCAYVARVQARTSACSHADLLEGRALGADVADSMLGSAPLDIGDRPTPPAPAPKPRGLDLGLWLDDGPRVALDPAYLERLRALPLSHVAVMAERSGGGWDPTWSIAQLRELRAALPTHERVLTVWPQPTPAYLEDLDAALPAMLTALGTRTVEIDTEGHWKARHVKGYRTLAEAGSALMSVLRGHADVVELTTFPLHTEASGPGSIRGEDRLWLQSYTIAEVRGETREWAGRYGPGVRPEADAARAHRVTRGEGLEVCLGLAAWAQDDWPGEPEEAMAAAVESARRADVRRLRWWSSKWVVGSRRTSYGAAAIAAAGAVAVAGAQV